MAELELESTYLAKFIPEDLSNSEHKEIIDLYLPPNAEHPRIRIRQNGDKYMITKKVPSDSNDASVHHEHTIEISPEEFIALSKVPSKRLRKLRYYYEYQGKTAEIDVFQDELSGLILVEFEFNSQKKHDNFEMPDFCLVDVTQEKFIAGGVLAGKVYQDIEPELNRFVYKRLVPENA